ncbi:hypothetical protein SAMN05443247_04970 [Bradyrhizobium erythrophlei]|nr:hypothetical protein SAMN05443247_04970 [Bradyrhizobium erythrophlei]
MGGTSPNLYGVLSGPTKSESPNLLISRMPPKILESGNQRILSRFRLKTKKILSRSGRCARCWGRCPLAATNTRACGFGNYSEKIFVKRACGRAIVASMGVLRLRCILCSRSVGQRPVPLSAKAGRETVESHFRRIRALRRRSRSAARYARGSSSMSPTSRPSKGRSGFGHFGPGGRSSAARLFRCASGSDGEKQAK